jgi:hypothetical protein
MKLIQCPYFTMDFPIISRTLQKMFVICEISMWQTNYLPSWIDFLFDTLIYWNFWFFCFGTNMLILAQGMFIFKKITIKFSHTWHWIIKNILLRCIRNLYYDSNFSIVKPCFIHNYSNDRIENVLSQIYKASELILKTSKNTNAIGLSFETSCH